MKELDQWRDYAESGMQIFIPHFRDMDVVKNVEIAHTVIKAGYTPVPMFRRAMYMMKTN